MKDLLRWLTSLLPAGSVSRERQEQDLKDELASRCW
jgi:hypothetical protein